MGGAATGHCLCGAVTLRVAQVPDEMAVCHCDMCRRWNGGMPYLGMRVKKADTRFGGEDNIAVYRSSDWAERGFCRVCGSHLFYRLAGRAATENLSLCPGLLDSMDGILLVEEECFDAKPDGYAFADVPKRRLWAEMEAELAAHLAGRAGG